MKTLLASNKLSTLIAADLPEVMTLVSMVKGSGTGRGGVKSTVIIKADLGFKISVEFTFGNGATDTYEKFDKFASWLQITGKVDAAKARRLAA